VIERVVNRDLAAEFDRQPPSLGEIRIADTVLRAGAAGPTEIPRPPIAGAAAGWRHEQAHRSGRSRAALLLAPLALRLKAAAGDKIRLISRQPRKLPAERINPALERVVEHIGDHDHPAAHPLAGAAEVWMVELRHAAVTVDHRLQHAQHGIGTEAVPLGQVINHLLAG
jgi:diacylglycerol kinase